MKFSLLSGGSKSPYRFLKILSWVVMIFGIGVITLGFLVRDQMPAMAQTEPAIEEVVQPGEMPGQNLQQPVQNNEISDVVQQPQTAQAAPPSVDSNPAAGSEPAAPKADSGVDLKSFPDDYQAAKKSGMTAHQALIEQKKSEDTSSIFSRIMSIFGIFGFVGIAWLLSDNKKKVLWKLVAIGMGMQLLFAVFILWTPVGKAIFAWLNDAFTVLIGFTQYGVNFLFASFSSGTVESALGNTAMSILPPIIFFSSLMTVLYHLGVMQWIVRGMAKFMMKFMGVSGAESLSSVANIFVGMTEAPLVIKPYVSKMTRSELFAIMSGGMATVAGGVMASYVAMLQPFFPDIAGHLIAASVMSAPASLVAAKLMIPETETPETMGKCELENNKVDANVIDAAARGAGEGLHLALNVGAMLLAFIALIALINYFLGLPSRLVNAHTYNHVAEYVVEAGGQTDPACENIYSTADTIACTHGALLTLASLKNIELPKEQATLSNKDSQSDKIEKVDQIYEKVVGATADEKLEQKSIWPLISLESLFGFIFFPFAFLMGVPLSDCYLVGQLLGEKMAINEFVAYMHLSQVLDQLSYRSIVISTYALCGFANFGSIAIQIGGIGGMAPNRRSDIAKLGIKSMIAGTIAAFMTATIAGALV